MKNLFKVLLSISALLFYQTINAQDHFVYQDSDPNVHTSFVDIETFYVPTFLPDGQIVDLPRSVVVGQRSNNIIMDSNTSAIIMCLDENNQILWEKEIQPSQVGRNCGFNKVIITTNPINSLTEIVVSGYMDGGHDYAASEALVARYHTNGTMLAQNTYYTSDQGTGGDVFFDIRQNPNNGNLYACGARNFRPDDSQSIVTQINYLNLSPVWYYQYLDDEYLSSDAFHTLDFYDGNVLIFGLNRVDQNQYDMTFLNIDEVLGTTVNTYSIFDVASRANNVNWPVELIIDPQTGNFLLTSFTANQFSAAISNTHFVIGGDVLQNSLNINEVWEYANDDGLTHENNISIIPIDINNGDFIISQSPGSASSSNPGNLSANAANLQTTISQISGWSTLQQCFTIDVEGSQWLSGAVKKGNEIFMAGSSVGNSVQANRDAYIFRFPDTWQFTNDDCPVEQDLINISQHSATPADRTEVREEFTPHEEDATDREITLTAVNLCPITCDLVEEDKRLKDETIQATSSNNIVMLEGKYSIEGTVTVAAGTILDVTNVDMLFGPCAQLVINGTLRTNNSVYRPCEPNDTWLGIHFTATSINNVINECTFKNAESALYFQESNDPVINSNTFVNNRWGIYFNTAVSDNPISNNLMTHNSKYPNLVFCDLAVPSSWNGHLVIYNSTIQSEFSNNKLQNHSGNTQDYFGIICHSGRIQTINSNVFSNLDHAIFMTSLSQPELPKIRINNNSMEIQEATSNSAQIFLNYVYEPVEIISNDIKSSDRNRGASGIELLLCSGTEILRNHLEGFKIGVQVNSSVSCRVNENSLFKQGEYAIYIDNSNRTVVKCNSIEGHNQSVGIVNTNRASYSEIESNCISNTSTGIYLGSNSQFSEILNNFLYNYENVGLLNDGEINLSLGSGIINGQNSFIDHNTSAVDVVTMPTFATVCHNNFDILSTLGNTTFTSQASVYSTAICGQQLYNLSNQPKPIKYACDEIQPHNITDINSLIIVLGLRENDEGLEFNYYKFLKQTTPELASKFRAKVVDNRDLGENAMHWFLSRESEDLGKIDFAVNHLKKLVSKNSYEKALQIIELNRLATLKNGKLIQLSSDDLTFLVDMFDAEATLHNPIAMALDKNGVSARIKVSNPSIREFTIPNELRFLERDINQLHIYPNPADDLLTLEFSIEKPDESIFIIVTDLLGRNLQTQKSKMTAGSMDLDIASLTAGTYLVTVTTKDEILTQKFVKK